MTLFQKSLKAAVLSFVLLYAGALLRAAEATPEAALQTTINRVIDALHVSGGDTSMEQKREEVLAILGDSFSFDIIIRRALGRNWNKLSPAQQSSIELLVTDLLIRAYTRELLNGPKPDIKFLDTEVLSSNKIEVPTRVSYKGNQVAVNYRLANIKNRGWQVYDVLIEGVSMVSNYREQFDSHFQTKDASELLETLKKKLEDFDA